MNKLYEGLLEVAQEVVTGDGQQVKDEMEKQIEELQESFDKQFHTLNEVYEGRVPEYESVDLEAQEKMIGYLSVLAEMIEYAVPVESEWEEDSFDYEFETYFRETGD